MKQCLCDLLPVVPSSPHVGCIDPECLGRELVGAVSPGRGLCCSCSEGTCFSQNLCTHLVSSLEALAGSALITFPTSSYTSSPSPLSASSSSLSSPLLPSATLQLPPCPSSHPCLHSSCLLCLPPTRASHRLCLSADGLASHPQLSMGCWLPVGIKDTFSPPLFEVICSSWGFHEHQSYPREQEFSSSSLQRAFVWGLGTQGRQSEGCLIKKGLWCLWLCMRWWEGEQGTGGLWNKMHTRLQAFWKLCFQV